MIPSQWSDVIADAIRNHPFNVTTLTQSDFKDLSGIGDALKKTSNSRSLKFLVKFSRDDPFTVSVRASHNLLRPWERHKILKLSKRNSNHAAFPKAFHASPASLPQLYTALIPIKNQKKDNLMDILATWILFVLWKLTFRIMPQKICYILASVPLCMLKKKAINKLFVGHDRLPLVLLSCSLSGITLHVTVLPTTYIVFLLDYHLTLKNRLTWAQIDLHYIIQLHDIP